MKPKNYFAFKTKLDVPIVLDPSNFTPESRTPWGGFAIARLYKKHLQGSIINRVPEQIGESWEFSLDPSFPSKALLDGTPISEIISRFPQEVFSEERLKRGLGHCHILVKLLEAKEPLSLQVHPDDKDPDLKAHECGKPESWLVLHAQKGAGIYLGFKNPLTKGELKEILAREGDYAKNFLKFVPVEPGSYFEIKPGIRHAIGPGVVILEPQRVLPNREGKTFRLWDWGRLYQGKQRELHLAEGLKLIDPQTQCGDFFVSTLARRAEKTTHKVGEKTYEKFTYPANPEYQTTWIKGQDGITLSCSVLMGFAVMTVIRGQVRILKNSGERFELSHAETILTETTESSSGKDGTDPFLVKSGMTVLVPHALFPVKLEFIKSEDSLSETPRLTENHGEVECVFVIPTPSQLSI